MKQPPTLTGELRQYLHAAVTRQRCKAEKVARQMLVNRRTLSRQLRAEGTSFKRLSNEAQFRGQGPFGRYQHGYWAHLDGSGLLPARCLHARLPALVGPDAQHVAAGAPTED